MRSTRVRPRDEAGFSLIEVVVAITLAAVLLTGGAHALASSLKATVFARNNSQAAELLTETIELLRSTDYGALAMVATDLATDTNVTGTAPTLMVDPDGTGPVGVETIVLAGTGVVSPHVTTETRNSQEYTVRTYVTAPVDSAVTNAGYKRISVEATWTIGARTHERQASTIVTQTRRGLPLPNFQIVAKDGEPDVPITSNTGTDLVLPFDVVNRGARDAFNLEVTSSPSTTATFSLLTDEPDVGDYDASADAAAPDSDTDGTPDTGMLEVDQTQSMLAVATVPASAVSGRYVFTVTATSVGQPAAGGATRSATFTVDIVSDESCVECTFQAVYLRNQYPACDVQPCDSIAQPTMPLRAETPTAAGLANFDTDVDVGPGRALHLAAATPPWTTTDTSLAATWRYAVPQNLTLSGEMIVDLQVAVAGSGTTPGSMSPVAVRVYVSRSINGSGATEYVGEGTASYGALGTSEFHPLRVKIGNLNTTVGKNRFLEVKVVVDSDTSLGDVWLGYDATSEPAVVFLPVG